MFTLGALLYLHDYVVAGSTIAPQIVVSDSNVAPDELKLISDNGLLFITNITRLDQNNYVALIFPPSEAFILQVVGRDMNGYIFSRITDISVEVSTIEVSLGMLQCILYYSYGSVGHCPIFAMNTVLGFTYYLYGKKLLRKQWNLLVMC